MLAEAQRRSEGLALNYSLSDLEQPGCALRPGVDLVTSILAMDEMDQLEAAFQNIAETLAPDGTAMLVVMDPLKERERNREALEACLNGNSSHDKAVLIVKTFQSNGLAPVAPYSRIVRPLAQYAVAAAAAGLRQGPVEQLLSHDVGIGPYSGTLLFDILTFQKTGALTVELHQDASPLPIESAKREPAVAGLLDCLIAKNYERTAPHQWRWPRWK
jgi:hypothetical protein